MIRIRVKSFTKRFSDYCWKASGEERSRALGSVAYVDSSVGRERGSEKGIELQCP